jgi:hypothetical protein
MLPLYHKLTVRDPVAPTGFYAVQGGFKYERPIPPERIRIEFIDPATA